ncbi:MAG: lipoyl(octanoyl) transferase LipB, partial [Muribaculaceae bacterium]|nr:lipoyl(octanoyl) transferase LipB [Muribaculaceae bacterium]
MLEIRDLGRMEYEDAWNLQHSIFDVMVENKRKGNRNSNETVLLVEHSPVITLGRHARKDNVLFSSDMLVKQGVRIFEIERGGDVTYHGPGQLVAYPLMDLEIHKMGIKKYMNMLEEVVIRTLAHYEVRGERVEGASGVWIGAGTERERKICAVGVKCSRFCTMHGLALNINT